MEPIFQRWQIDLLEWTRTQGLKLLLVLIVAVLLFRFLKFVTDQLVLLSSQGRLPTPLRTEQVRTMASVVYSAGSFVILFVTALQVLLVFGLQVMPLLAGAGVVGLAIGLGAQTLVRDMISGMFILIEDQFDVGETVGIANLKGTVEKLTLRRTLLRGEDGSLHTVPNSQITTVTNYTRATGASGGVS